MIEVETNDVEVEVVDGIEATSTGSVGVEVVDLGELDITVAKKEYTITGDSIYVPVLYDDAPQWMKDLVGLAVEVSMESANASTIGQLNQMLGEFATSYVPLNQYTQSINDLSNADTSLHSLVTTLNSNFNDGLSEANSQIIGLQSTKASKTEVVTMVIDTIAAQLADGSSDIGAVVANLNQAIVNETTARANSMSVLTAHLDNIDSGVTANATALNNTMAYVGVNSAGAETGTGLSAYLSAGGVVGSANSKVANNVYVDAQGNVKSKYEYNSTVTVNGVNYSSGFGLSNSAGTGIGSEFWIDATKLKFTNSAKTGRNAPFTIDVSGTTPLITFNGKVSFTNVTDTTNLTNSIATAQNTANNAQSTANTANSNALARTLPSEVANAINTNTTTIDGAKITTGSISAAQINTVGLYAENIMASSTINGNTINGSVITGARINGSIIKTSYIDLDGDLQILTDYHVSVPQYNANPELFIDCIYDSTYGEYRIPTKSYISNVGSSAYTVTVTNLTTDSAGHDIASNIFSHNTGNSRTKTKCRTERPVINMPNTKVLYWKQWGTFNIGWDYPVCRLYLAGVEILYLHVTTYGNQSDNPIWKVRAQSVTSGYQETAPLADATTYNVDFVVSAAGFTITVNCSNTSNYVYDTNLEAYHWASTGLALSISVVAENVTSMYDYNGGNLLWLQYYANMGPQYSGHKAALTAYKPGAIININNMI